jgi:putative transposase
MNEYSIRKRNRLPLGEYIGVKAYSLTLATAGRTRFFEDEQIVSLCLGTLKETAERCNFDVYAYCFMPDHLHLLVGSDQQEADLIDFVKRFKQKAGWWFRNVYTGGLKASPTGLWQRSYYDHIVRSSENLRSAAEYIIRNPVAAGLTQDVGEYSFAGSFIWPELNPHEN